jgi:hypothetical protein
MKKPRTVMVRGFFVGDDFMLNNGVETKFHDNRIHQGSQFPPHYAAAPLSPFQSMRKLNRTDRGTDQ